jgi:transposase-like protein
METIPTPRTLLEAVTAFADPDVARQYFEAQRWPNGAGCPRDGCGSADVRFISGRRPRWYCRECKRDFTAKTGTVFEDSPIGFDKWLPAMWLLSSAKNGISSHELGRSLGVTQKTGWFMLHRVRLAMTAKSFERPLSGIVEADETYIGGKSRRPNIGAGNVNKKPSGPKRGKAIVHGIMERGGEMRAFVVPDDKAKTLLSNIYRHVEPTASIFTDAHRAYWDLQFTHRHEFVNHMIAYVEGHVHTNHVENFWSVLKRALKGTYINVRPWHLMRYVEAQVFRFNARQQTDGPRFAQTLRGADQKRITYKALTAANPVWRLKPGRASRSPIYRARA